MATRAYMTHTCLFYFTCYAWCVCFASELNNDKVGVRATLYAYDSLTMRLCAYVQAVLWVATPVMAHRAARSHGVGMSRTRHAQRKRTQPAPVKTRSDQVLLATARRSLLPNPQSVPVSIGQLQALRE